MAYVEARLRALAERTRVGLCISPVSPGGDLDCGDIPGVGNDPVYTPTTCFETFPLPWAPNQEPWRDARVHAIAQAARELDAARRRGCRDAQETDVHEPLQRRLADLHAALDRAVWAAYGWDDPDPATVPEDEILTRLLALNLERAGM